MKMLKFIYILCFSFMLITKVNANSGISNNNEFTKGVLINMIDLGSSSNTSARLSQLSPSAIEKGLRDAQILAKPSYNNKTQVLTLQWHSIVKTMNGTEKSRSLTEPLVTQLKVANGSTSIASGQEITIKGDVSALVSDFDELVKSAETVALESEGNNTSNITQEDESSYGGDSGAGDNQGGGGSLAEGGLTENPETEELDIEQDNITTTTEQCVLNVDWASMSVFKQERKIKTSASGDLDERSECENYGKANKIEKDYSSTCDIQINGLSGYMAGFIYYTFVNGEQVSLSGCKYESTEQKTMIIKNDFGKCNLEQASVNLAQNVFYPFAVRYTLINGERYDLTECTVIGTAETPLPTKIESCQLDHSIEDMTTYKTTRSDTYNPTENTLLRKGSCSRAESFPILKDFEAGCTIKFDDDGSYVKGFKYFSFVDNERQDISACEYEAETLKASTVLKDFDSCSLNYATVNAESGTYNPAFIKYTLVDGERYDLGGCDVSVEEVLELPTHIEVCEKSHSIPALEAYENERVDIYDPANKSRVVEGGCYVKKTIPIQQDFDAGCPIQLNAPFNTYTRGFKHYSSYSDGKAFLSECEYSIDNALTYVSFKDYSECELDLAVVDLTNDQYQPAFKKYTLIDGLRYDLTSCENEATDVRELPKEADFCEMAYDYVNLKAHDMEQIHVYDPQKKIVLRSDDCYSIKEFPLIRDFEFEDCGDLANYTDQNISLGYRHYYNRTENNSEYVGGCGLDIANKKAIFETVEDCAVSENLTAYTATINKKWHFITNTGEKEFVSKCNTSSETYPIVDTANTCSPQYVPSLNKAVIQKRKGWQDSNGEWHYSTNCVPTDEESTISKEFCSSPQFEHDLVGGQSYKRSRNYYIYNDEKIYINGCSRDATISYSHVVSTCGTVNNDTARYTQYKNTTTVTIDGVKSTLSACAATGQKIYYVPLASKVIYVQTEKANNCRYGGAVTISSIYNSYMSKSYGAPVFSPSSNSTRTSSCYTGGSDSQLSKVNVATLTVTDYPYLRGDGTNVVLNRTVIVK